jgi:hypothetical protein
VLGASVRYWTFRMFWWKTWRTMRDAFWALFVGGETARALVSAWGGRKVFDGLTAPYGPHRDAACYCVDCLDSVEERYFTTHEGRCWYCQHLKESVTQEVWDYYASLYQERY